MWSEPQVVQDEGARDVPVSEVPRDRRLFFFFFSPVLGMESRASSTCKRSAPRACSLCLPRGGRETDLWQESSLVPALLSLLKSMEATSGQGWVGAASPLRLLWALTSEPGRQSPTRGPGEAQELDRRPTYSSGTLLARDRSPHGRVEHSPLNVNSCKVGDTLLYEKCAFRNSHLAEVCICIW
jgi:hypothetical protein